MLEGCCSTYSLSLLQRYTKNVKKPNFLIKKPSQWKKYPPTRKIKKMRFRIANLILYEIRASITILLRCKDIQKILNNQIIEEFF